MTADDCLSETADPRRGGLLSIIDAAGAASRRPERPLLRWPEMIIAERNSGSYTELALLRWALVIVFLWFGGMKFTAYEAAGIAPFIQHSPILGWLGALLGAQGASHVVGVLELSTAAALVIGAFNPIISAIGAAMSCVTYLITLSFFLSTPGVAEPAAGGFPAISAPVGQFLLKDLVLLAASAVLLIASVRRPSRRPVSSGG